MIIGALANHAAPANCHPPGSRRFHSDVARTALLAAAYTHEPTQ